MSCTPTLTVNGCRVARSCICRYFSIHAAVSGHLDPVVRKKLPSVCRTRQQVGEIASESDSLRRRMPSRWSRCSRTRRCSGTWTRRATPRCTSPPRRMPAGRSRVTSSAEVEEGAQRTHFRNAKPYMRCVNSVCIVFSKRQVQNLIACYC
jgi:hypothetical protein